MDLKVFKAACLCCCGAICCCRCCCDIICCCRCFNGVFAVVVYFVVVTLEVSLWLFDNCRQICIDKL